MNGLKVGFANGMSTSSAHQNGCSSNLNGSCHPGNGFIPSSKTSKDTNGYLLESNDVIVTNGRNGFHANGFHANGFQATCSQKNGLHRRVEPSVSTGVCGGDVKAPEDSKVVSGEAGSVPTRTQIMIDPANICTFSGAILAVLALSSIWSGRYYLGMFFNVAANIADIIDGPIARSTPHRAPAFSVVGSKLDCYADLVSHFVVPGSLLIHIGGQGWFSMLLAGLYVCSGIMRQSYFEVTGRCEGGSCIFGLTSDYMVGIYTLTMHAGPLLGTNNLFWALVPTILLMMFCSLTFSLRSRRYDGMDLVLVAAYNAVLCGSCGLLALYADNNSIQKSISMVMLPLLTVLAYPMYFRHVEINH